MFKKGRQNTQDFQNTILLANCFPINPTSQYVNYEEGATPGLFIFIKNKANDDIRILPNEGIVGIVGSYVPYKIAWPTTKGGVSQGLPFCLSVLEDTSARKSENGYIVGPLCYGKEDKIPACPLFSEGVCKIGHLVFFITPEKEILKIHIRNKTERDFFKLTKEIEAFKPLSLSSVKSKQNYYSNFSVSKETKQYDITEEMRVIEGEINRMVKIQREGEQK